MKTVSGHRCFSLRTFQPGELAQALRSTVAQLSSDSSTVRFSLEQIQPDGLGITENPTSYEELNPICDLQTHSTLLEVWFRGSQGGKSYFNISARSGCILIVATFGTRDCLQQFFGLIIGALDLKEIEEPDLILSPQASAPYIDFGRLQELRAIASPDFDFAKLVRLCEELNVCHANECYYAVAMLARAILDHVPPVFHSQTFAAVANNYAGGGKSFKGCMLHLEGGLRKIADAHLHMPIRKKETRPTRAQVNFASELDMLLAEIVRILT